MDPAYTVTYICALNTTDQLSTLSNSLTNLNHRSVYLSRIACTCFPARIIPTRLPAHQAHSPPINACDKTVANELWTLIFFHGCKLFVLDARHCSLNNTELGTMVSLAISFGRRGWSTKLNPEKPGLTWIIFKDAVRITHYTHNSPVITPVNYIQGVPGGKDLTSGECSLGQTTPI
jgi:hypothetical protein